MSSNNIIDFTSLKKLEELNLDLPENNVKAFLINNGVIKLRKAPDRFIYRLVVSEKGTDIVLWLKNKSSFESFKRNFKSDNFEWYSINQKFLN